MYKIERQGTERQFSAGGNDSVYGVCGAGQHAKNS